ncbi:MAG: quinolinate synthase NadA [Elusimicrobiota bacterium]
MNTKEDIKQHIKKLKEERGAVILAHNYQLPEIQDIADFTGDSLGLSRKAASTEAEVIVFCGVDFMAETAKILSPDKKVLNPAEDATCPMADMISARELREFKEEYREAVAVSYVNTSAQVKAESDVCCTSSNCVKVVNSLSEDKVIFSPDRNLASYVRGKTDKEIIAWEGFCPVHDSIRAQEVKKTMEAHPGAPLMAHPECRADVLELADYVVSTSGMFNTPLEDKSGEFIVGTEEGLIYGLKKKFPDRQFIPAAGSIVCPNMKKMNLEKVLYSLENLKGEVELDEDVIKKASLALRRMLNIG